MPTPIPINKQELLIIVQIKEYLTLYHQITHHDAITEEELVELAGERREEAP